MDPSGVRVPEASFLDSPTAYLDAGVPVTVMAQDPTPQRILDVQQHPKVQYAFGPDTVGDGTLARLATSMDLIVGLLPATRWPPGVLESLVTYYLTSPTLRVPIEPFGLVSSAIVEGRGLTLWDIYGETLGRNYYVDAQGRVSLSPRWADQGRHFGTVADDLDAFESSDLWKFVQDYRLGLFTSLSRCATCRHHPWCAGFLLATESDDTACDQWKASMDLLLDAYHALKEEEASESNP